MRQVTVSQVDTPLWFHCKQPNGNHCGQGKCLFFLTSILCVSNCLIIIGMVFAINPPADGNNTFEAFQAAARTTLNATSTTTSAFITPSPQPWSTATATVTNGSSVWTTTYTSYLGSVRKSHDMHTPYSPNWFLIMLQLLRPLPNLWTIGSPLAQTAYSRTTPPIFLQLLAIP